MSIEPFQRVPKFLVHEIIILFVLDDFVAPNQSTWWNGGQAPVNFKLWNYEYSCK